MKLRLRLLIVVALALPLLDVAIAPSLAQDSSQRTPQVNCDSLQTTETMPFSVFPKLPIYCLAT